MAHFAKIENGIVTNVIVATQEFIDMLPDKDTWLQTSYNTTRGLHKTGSEPIRKNYAGIGYTYDEIRDAFIPPKTYGSWTLDEDTCMWIPPIPYPEDGKNYDWDEEKIGWTPTKYKEQLK